MYKQLKKTIKLSLILASMGATAPAFSSIINYNFNFDVTGDASSGNNYTGNFSYDDTTGSLGFGGETIYNLSSFSFIFDNVNYSETDDPIATAVMGWDNQFLGIAYDANIADDNITFSLGTLGYKPFVPSAPLTAVFNYSINTNSSMGNSGVINYSLISSVPTPPSLLLLTLGLGIGWSQRKRNTPVCSNTFANFNLS